ncbi:uncharacterized protein LOC122877756 isoform X1 [Siniperca chuatsi]|uniref:uncharacterized protein LOC122877756 isoform X1 n=1 Tax=Siniperca chuatsi TaxID=119488 RepID=UPI001CE18214|nr:uncharacterized protein LOC122877756 isoform X1 [Siniperca chuatsi]XP_044055685.1 uncharacterized protein LOC122877756 isoform X1 [Siniperca chuatsi]
MAVAHGPFLAAVLLLVSLGLHCSSPLPACPESCTCQGAPLLNCSSSGLSLVPQHIQDSVTELDLSHNLLDSVKLNRPHQNLRNVWLGNNSITHLSLCIERNLGNHYVRGRHRLRPWGRQGCVSWAPTLHLLSVEWNQLEQLPEGLEGSESLQVLQLSFNKISTLQPGDLSHLRQLKELHLQHNLITSLHPQMFQDLAQLRVLDLSFNMLTSLHPLMYLSLRNIGVDVRLSGNRWQCNCSMRSLRRRMAYDSSRGLKAWSVVCASPSILSGRDLLQLGEDDLNCFSTENRPELHQDVTVYSGSQILLSCSTQDSMWWTPSGQASVSQPQAGLLISDITERDTGLYVCMSEEHEVVSVFNLQISKIGGARRKTRSLPRTSRQIIPQGTPNRIGQERNQRATQSNLTLAVCLSVLITFLIAFILGVLARPCIDDLWRRVTNRKSSSATNSVSSVEQRQYDNEAYSNGEEPEIGTHRERRVTFSTVDYREDSNVQYYDTVASGDQESINNDAVIECEAAEAESDTHTAGDSGSENSLQQSSPEDNQKDGRDLSGVSDAGRTHNIEFEHITDPVELEERRSLSSCSDSLLSDKVFNEDQMTQRDCTTPKSPQLADDSVQQRADFSTVRKVEVPQISIEGSSGIPVVSSEPFADWSPHINDTNLEDPDLWQENGEQFEFSDSVRSTSARSSSVSGSFNDSKLIVAPTSDKQKREDMSSSSSYVSGDEPTQYTVNSDQEEEEDIERNHNKPEVTNACLKQDASIEQHIHGVDSVRPLVGFNKGEYRYDTPRPAVRPEQSFSSHSSDSDGEDYTIKQEPHKGDGKDKSICVSEKPSSRIVTGEWDTREKVKPMPRTKWRVTSLGVTSHSKSLDTGAPSPPAAYSSSSSSESEAEITDLKVEHNTGRVNEGIKINEPETLSTDLNRQCIPQIKRRLDIRAPSPPTDSSSSGESADETMDHIEKQGEMHVTRLQFQESQTVNHDSDTQWPALDLQHTMRIKRRLDIKAPSADSDSSSTSEIVEEKIAQIKKHEQGEVHVSRLPFQESQAGSHDPETRWPSLDLEHIPRIKRRLDIKAPSPPPDLFSSSDSEDETTSHIKKQKKGQTHIARLPIKVSQTVSHDPKTQWPALYLEHTTRIKRRLDIKAPPPESDSSSSSDSEDETTNHTERPGKVDIVELAFQKSQTVSHDPQTQWPALDLEHIPHIKRRLDIKAPSPPPDSASNSEIVEEKIAQIKKREQGEVHVSRLPFQESQAGSHDPETRWPALDLHHTMRIKRRLDIKAPSADSDSFSSSDSEDETTSHIKKQKKGQTHIARLPIKVSQTVSHDPKTQRPALYLEHTTRIKRRLDIKAPPPESDSSSSSDSEDETTNHTERPGKVDIVELAFQKSQTVSHDPQTQWPALDLEHIPHIKRRLDIKAPSPPPDSASNSEIVEEKIAQIKKREQGEVHVSRLPFQESQAGSHDPETRWPALDLHHTMRIKRRLDIKAPSADSDSFSSSDSEDETTGHIEKQRPGKVDIAGLPFQESQTESHDPGTRWPALDLEHIPRIKRRLDIKAPSPPPDSSSSSDNEDETTNPIKKQEKGQTHMARLPIKASQTVSHDPQTQWPALDLEHIPRIKRRLDIKAPSPPSDSASNSEIVEEQIAQIKKREQGEVHVSRLPFQESQAGSHEPETRWPALDLHHTMRIKRRLDIKAPSADSDSFSSSDSEDETTGHIEKQRPGKVDIAGLPFQESQTESHDPDTRWPALDLEHIPRIKRRLDIKAPSPPPDSSSSSDNEDETTNPIKKQEKGQTHMARLPIKASQTVSHDPQTQWPALDLEHIPHIKRRLDIKAPSPPSDSASNSEIVEEKIAQIKKREQGEVHVSRLPFQESQAGSHDPETRWPALDLHHTMRIKRRLDIKAPSADSDSFSSSDSEDETTGHIEKQRPGKVDIAGLPFQESQTESHDPGTRWPALDLEHIPRIKRRLDIKAPSPPPDSSSSSDNEDETTNPIKKQEKGQTHMARLPIKASQTVSHDPQTQWPALDLEHIPRIKRRLDIKAPSPPPDSASNSEIVEEKIAQIKKREQGEVHVSRLPFQESQAGSHDPETRWPALDLHHTMRIKRRLDIKAPSADSDSFSSSDSEDETTGHIEKQRPGKVDIAGLPFQESQTESHDPDTRWPALDLEHIPRIKRRLDIKAPSPPPDSSSSSDNEDETTNPIKKQEKGQTHMARLPIKASQTVSHDPQTQWPALDLEHIPRIKRRLDIKAPSPPPDSASNSEIVEEKIAQIKKREQGEVHVSRLPFQESHAGSHDPETLWPALDLQHTTRIKRHLDIKAPSADSDSFSSSDSEDETTNHIRSPKTRVINISRSPKTDHNIKLEKYTVITDVGDKTRDNIGTTPEINPELESRWATMNLGISRFRKRLEITSHTHEPPNLPSSPPPDSPSSSSNETGSKSSRTRRKRRGVGMPGIIHTESSLKQTNKPVNALSLKGQDDNSGNSVEVKERLRKDYSLPTTEEKSNPDTMLTGFGTPHFRRYLDIKVSEKAPATPPLRSTSSSENKDVSTHHAGKGWRGRSQLPVVTDKEASQNHTSLYVGQAVNIKLDQSQSQTEEVERKAGGERKSQTKVGEESDSVQPHLRLTTIPHIRRALDIRAPLQREASSSSNSENETIDHSVPDLNLGVPHVKRCLNVKAPLPESSNSPSSCSESENEVANMSDNDSLITYKRLIIKTLSPPSNSSSPSGQTIHQTNQRHTRAETVTVAQGPSHSVGDRNASLVPRRVPSMNITTNADLPPKIRWTGVGLPLSDLSISSQRRHQDVGLSSPQQAPPAEPELPPPDSFNSSSSKSDDKIKQDRGKADVTLVHKYSSLSTNSVSLASSRALEKFDNSPSSTNEILRAVSEDKMERKGLSALKVMSSERRKWDTEDENLDKGASPLFDDHGSQGDTSFNYCRSEEYIKSLAKQPLTKFLSYTSADEIRATDLLYDIPRYRMHDIEHIEPLQEAPPPIPATPPPDEAVGLTWRSPQSNKKQALEGTRSYLQQSRNTEESDPSSLTSQNLAVYFDSSNMNISDV